MARNWPVLTLREAGVALIDCEHRTPPAAASGYPYVAIPQMKQGRLDLSDARRISAEHFTEWTKKARPRADDVILSRRCNPGETVVVPAGLDCALGQNLVLLRADGTKVNPQFLRWMVRGPEWWNQIGMFLNAGAIFDSLKCADVPNFRLSVPPLPDQRAIAGVLGALDDKIEVNRKTARVLEGIARAVFTSWFVDFDPVRRAAAGQPTSLPPDLATLFPKRLVDSPIGEVPEGWRVGKIGDHVELQRGTTYKSSLKGLPGPVLLGLASIHRNGGFRDDNLSTYGGSSPVHMTLEPGELFVSLKDVTQSADLLGAIARVPRHVPKGRLTQDTVKLIIKPGGISPNIVYAALLRQEYRDYCRGRSTGTTNLGLSREDFLSYPIVEPTKIVQAEFDRMADALDRRSAICVMQSRTLAALRDTLLPKLISGELRIADAKSIVGRAL